MQPGENPVRLSRWNYLFHYRYVGAVVCCIVLVALFYWMYYGRHVALQAVVHVGRHDFVGLLEPVDELERFVQNNVLAASPIHNGNCTAKAKFLDGPSLVILCNGSNAVAVNDAAMQIADKIISRHAKYYDNANNLWGIRKSYYERSLGLRRASVSDLSVMLIQGRGDPAILKTKIFEIKEEIIRLSADLELLERKSKRNAMTFVNYDKPVVRRFGLAGVLMILFAGLLSGFICMSILAVGRVEYLRTNLNK